jgi:hypothetical protein
MGSFEFNKMRQIENIRNCKYRNKNKYTDTYNKYFIYFERDDFIVLRINYFVYKSVPRTGFCTTFFEFEKRVVVCNTKLSW